MTTPERRQKLYSEMLCFMKLHKANTVPINLSGLCQSAGVQLLPLSSIIRDVGLSASDIFKIWGNEDGAINAYNEHYCIAFNDSQSPRRIRFTICEELAHMVYGHTKDAEFNVFSQNYDIEKYLQYDEEARLGAGFLACHPRFFYTYERFMNPRYLSEICNISLACATARCEIYDKYRDEIRRNISYQYSIMPKTEANLRWYEKMAHREWVLDKSS